MNDLPMAGEWYCIIGQEEPFQVVAIDEESSLVEVQHLDGDIEEYEIEEWEALDLEEIEPPEDSSAPYDNYSYDEDEEGEEIPDGFSLLGEEE